MVGTGGEDGGADPVARGEVGGKRVGFLGAAVEERGFVDGDAVVDVAEHFLVMRLADQGAEIRVRIHRVARPDVRHFLEEAFLEGGDLVFVHEDARAVRADLAAAEEIRHHGPVDRDVQVRVRQDQQRRFAAQFHRHVFHVAGRRGRHFLPRRHLPGEGDFGDARVRRQVGTDGAAAVDDVEDARREARFGVEFGEDLPVQRRYFGGLVDHGVAGGEAGRGFPEGTGGSGSQHVGCMGWIVVLWSVHLYRIVPCSYACADA